MYCSLNIYFKKQIFTNSVIDVKITYIFDNSFLGLYSSLSCKRRSTKIQMLHFLNMYSRESYILIFKNPLAHNDILYILEIIQSKIFSTRLEAVLPLNTHEELFLIIQNIFLVFIKIKSCTIAESLFKKT